MAKRPPSLFPLVDIEKLELGPGTEMPCSSFCSKAFRGKPECAAFYRSLADKKEDYYQCPFGFTTRTFRFFEAKYAVTGIIGYPRFDSPEERDMAKRFPSHKVSRFAVGKMIEFLQSVEAIRASEIEDAAKVLPQALHELRKLNAAVLQHAEKEASMRPSSALETIKSAAELMRNNFDILEAMANIDMLRQLPIDTTINLFDLAYKTKKVYEARANARNLGLYLEGNVRPIVRGSSKSFPIIPTVLIENAIKYARPHTNVYVTVSVSGNMAIMDVENKTDFKIDSTSCFNKGVRFAGAEVEGAGFGLYLAKRVAEIHNGTITCFANADDVCMSVSLPLVKVI